jgi:hypothetical protein
VAIPATVAIGGTEPVVGSTTRCSTRPSTSVPSIIGLDVAGHGAVGRRQLAPTDGVRDEDRAAVEFAPRCGAALQRVGDQPGGAVAVLPVVVAVGDDGVGRPRRRVAAGETSSSIQDGLEFIATGGYEDVDVPAARPVAVGFEGHRAEALEVAEAGGHESVAPPAAHEGRGWAAVRLDRLLDRGDLLLAETPRHHPPLTACETRTSVNLLDVLV